MLLGLLTLHTSPEQAPCLKIGLRSDPFENLLDQLLSISQENQKNILGTLQELIEFEQLTEGIELSVDSHMRSEAMTWVSDSFQQLASQLIHLAQHRQMDIASLLQQLLQNRTHLLVDLAPTVESLKQQGRAISIENLCEV